MKVYIIGSLLMLPALLMLTGSVVLMAIGFIYAILLWKSPRYSAKAKRFWRAWHKENFKVLLTLKIGD